MLVFFVSVSSERNTTSQNFSHDVEYQPQGGKEKLNLNSATCSTSNVTGMSREFPEPADITKLKVERK